MKNTFLTLIVLSALMGTITSCQKSVEQVAVPGANAQVQKDEMVDNEGNVYKTISIGGQTWMAENLRTTRYRNGDPIVNVVSAKEWSDQRTKADKGAWSFYNNDSTGSNGRLYNWYAAHDVRNIAPQGWHVPTNSEWQKLIDNMGGNGSASAKLKSSGFSNVQVGTRKSDGAFDATANFTNLWTVDQYDGNADAQYVLAVGLPKATGEVLSSQEGKFNGWNSLSGFPIRLVKD
jgi:uncharacterized protein (TIGR02145 family)